MLVAITGTPGTGKTAAAKELKSCGHEVRSLTEMLETISLLNEYDENSDSFLVDDKALESIEIDHGESTVFVEGHLAHHLACDMIVVLRCSPEVLESRLEERGYGAQKVKDNIEAELLDLILVESLERKALTYEIDCSHLRPKEVARSMIDIINGKVDDHIPGKVDWSEEGSKWF